MRDTLFWGERKQGRYQTYLTVRATDCAGANDAGEDEVDIC